MSVVKHRAAVIPGTVVCEDRRQGGTPWTNDDRRKEGWGKGEVKTSSK